MIGEYQNRLRAIEATPCERSVVRKDPLAEDSCFIPERSSASDWWEDEWALCVCGRVGVQALSCYSRFWMLPRLAAGLSLLLPNTTKELLFSKCCSKRRACASTCWTRCETVFRLPCMA
jgi:hypothetical protein